MIKEAQAMQSQLTDTRRRLHEFPEEGFKEVETTKFVREELKKLGITIQEIGLKTGVIGIIKGSKPGPMVALRADIDALPIQECNEVAYKSKNNGVMHACGHDAHITCLLGAAKLLVNHKESLAGSVKLIFQPAEEIDTGAKYVISKGALEGVQAIFGMHNMSSIEAGSVGIKDGPLMASIDKFIIHVRGVGGHGAQPDKTKDPVVAASAVVLALQTIVSRNLSPIDTAVLSCCTINGGVMYNIIPAEVTISGTVRLFDTALSAYVKNQIQKIASGVAGGLGAEISLEYENEMTPVVNNETTTAICSRAAEKVFGVDHIVVPELAMVGDDFTMYQQQIPGTYFFLGVGNKEKGYDKPLHSPNYNIEETALPYGAAMLAQTVLEYLTK